MEPTIGYFGIGVLLILFVLAILLIVLYIYTLVRQLKMKQYVWFVLTLLFSGLALPVYWVVKLFGGVK